MDAEMASAVSAKVLEFKRKRRRRRTRKRTGGNSWVFALFVLQSLVIVQLAAAIVQFAHSIPIVGGPLSRSEPSLGRRLAHLSNSTTWTGDQQEIRARRSREQAPQVAANSTPSSTALIRQQQEAAYMQRLAELRQKFVNNRAINDTAYYVLLLVYSSLIAIGTVSNLLICLTVVLKPQVLSPRNIFIVNLAYSDLLLCVFTMPFSFIEISMKMWQMGLIPCKLVAGLQATSIFVSTISITAIALDRYKVIVYPTHQETSGRTAALILGSVWIGALLLSSPLFCFRTVEHVPLPHKFDKFNVDSIDYCIELWPLKHGRGIYSVISMIFQYVLPITIVCCVYLKISRKLKKRLIRRQRLTQLECQQKRQLNLIKRTHTMLVSVALVFILSWLPLNLLNLIGDFSDVFKGEDQQFRLVFAVCHLIGCSSACSNPILYGYLNENFRKELHQVYSYHLIRSTRLLSRLFRRVCCFNSRQHISSSDSYEPNEDRTSSLERSEGRSSDDDNYSSHEDEEEENDDDDDGSNSDDQSERSSASSTRNPSRPAPPQIAGGDKQQQQDGNRARDGAGTAASMGPTMRFCLCIADGAGSSSTETLDNNVGPKKQAKNHSQRQPSIILQHDDRSMTTTTNMAPQIPKGGVTGASDRAAHKRRPFRCKCQCHSSSNNNNNNLGNNNRRKASGAAVDINSSGAGKTLASSAAQLKPAASRRKSVVGGENNGFVCLQEQLRRFSKCSTTSQQRRESGGGGGGGFACPSAGRRVWLRFWPASAGAGAAATSAGSRHVHRLSKKKEDDDHDGGDKRVTTTRQQRVVASFQQQQQQQQKGQSGAANNRQLDAEQSNEAKRRSRRRVDKQDKTGTENEEGKKRGGRTNNSPSVQRDQLAGSHCDSCREVAFEQQASSSSFAQSARKRRRRPRSGKASARVGSTKKTKGKDEFESERQSKRGVVSPKSSPDPDAAAAAAGHRQRRIEGLEMGLMLVGPGKRELPRQFAGSLFLSVESSGGRRRQEEVSQHERSTSFLALESTSLIVEQPQDCVADQKGNHLQQQQPGIAASSSLDAMIDNDHKRTAARRRRSFGGGDSLATRHVAAAAQVDSSAGVRVVVDGGGRDDNTIEAEDVEAARFHPDRQQPEAIGVQPERPVAGSTKRPAAIHPTVVAAADGASNSSGSSMCLTHSQHWHSTNTGSSTGSCTCSILSGGSGSSSGRSSCAASLNRVDGSPACEQKAPAPALESTGGNISTLTAGPRLLKPSLGNHLHDGDCDGDEAAARLCGADPESAAESCSSSLRSWASLEVARLMAHGSQPAKQPAVNGFSSNNNNNNNLANDADCHSSAVVKVKDERQLDKSSRQEK